MSLQNFFFFSFSVFPSPLAFPEPQNKNFLCGPSRFGIFEFIIFCISPRFHEFFFSSSFEHFVGCDFFFFFSNSCAAFKANEIYRWGKKGAWGVYTDLMSGVVGDRFWDSGEGVGV